MAVEEQCPTPRGEAAGGLVAFAWRARYTEPRFSLKRVPTLSGIAAASRHRMLSACYGTQNTGQDRCQHRAEVQSLFGIEQHHHVIGARLLFDFRELFYSIKCAAFIKPARLVGNCIV